MKHLLKSLVLFILAILIFTMSTSCGYNPPDGYTKKHHTYEEILDFAKSLDPNATVSEEYIDTTIDAWNRLFLFCYGYVGYHAGCNTFHNKISKRIFSNANLLLRSCYCHVG